MITPLLSMTPSAPSGATICYRAYGLHIRSEIPLPELVVSPVDQVDATIRLEALTNPIDTSCFHGFQLTAEGMYLYWESVGTLLIRNGREIIVDRVPDADAGRLRLFILGAALGVLLHQRGHFILHASAIAVEDRAVLFVGDKGWGKSTIAATLCKRGHRLLSDDVVPLMATGTTQQVIPAFPQLKLWTDAVTSLGYCLDDFPTLVPHLDKRDCRLSDAFDPSPVPLQHIFVLGLGDAIEIRRMSPQEVLLALMRNSYITRFGAELLQEGDRADHFLKLTQVAQQVAVWQLLRPRDLSQLSETAQRLEEHLRSPC
jgi:hypothetical protein